MQCLDRQRGADCPPWLCRDILSNLTHSDWCQAWHSIKFRKQSGLIADQALESYVRTDIPCGSSRCSYCTATAPALSAEASHYVLPDTTALAELLELFELPEMQHLLLLTSVVAKVRSQAPSP